MRQSTATPVRPDIPHTWYACALAGLALAVLLLTADYQIYDNNFYSLSEATALLAGEHPYRDFFERGIPLQAALSALTQWALGYRLLSEFGLQWVFILAGVVLAFHVAVRLSRSVLASMVTMVPAVMNLAATPTYQYPKLFLYPGAIILAWRYFERPDASRAAILGLFATVAFFFRHDHGLYVGAAVLLSFVLARLIHGDRLPARAIVRHIVGCGLTCALFVVPWAIVVERSEGLIAYVVARADINNAWAVQRSVFRAVLDMNPVKALTPAKVVAWDAEPFERVLAWLPARDGAQEWLHQVTLLVTVLVVLLALVRLVRVRSLEEDARLDASRLLLAGALAALVERQLFRETSYFVMLFPLAAAFGARLLADVFRATSTVQAQSGRLGWLRARQVVAVTIFGITVATVAGYARESNLLQPVYQLRVARRTFKRLLVSPPIDGLVPRDDVQDLDLRKWTNLSVGDRSDIIVRYLYDCTSSGDHVLVSGQTPYQIGYYAHRPVAGGHLYWHDGWRSDPTREGQSIALLEKQSVPFAYSTHDSVLDNLVWYPRLRAHFAQHYVEIPGSDGHLLVDSRRQATGTFARVGFPCFNSATPGRSP